MAAYASPSLPIPAVSEVGETPWGHFVVSERARGRLLDDLDEPGMRLVLPNLLRALDALAAIELPASGGYGLWRPDLTAPHATWREALLDLANDRPGSRTHGWRAALLVSPMGTRAFDHAFGELVSLSEDIPERREVIHADLLHNNVLIEGSFLRPM